MSPPAWIRSARGALGAEAGMPSAFQANRAFRTGHIRSRPPYLAGGTTRPMVGGAGGKGGGPLWDLLTGRGRCVIVVPELRRMMTPASFTSVDDRGTPPPPPRRRVLSRPEPHRRRGRPTHAGARTAVRAGHDGRAPGTAAGAVPPARPVAPARRPPALPDLPFRQPRTHAMHALPVPQSCQPRSRAALRRPATPTGSADEGHAVRPQQLSRA